MDKEKEKQLNKFLLEHSFNEMLNKRNNLNLLSKEATIFFIGAFMFLCGFLFNLSASIIYDLIKDNKGWKILILAVTAVSLIVFVWLIKKYIITPIKKTKEELEKNRLDTHSAIDRVVEDSYKSNS